MVTRWYCYAKMDFTCFIIRQNKQGLDQNGILLTLSEKSVRQLSNILPQKSNFHCFIFRQNKQDLAQDGIYLPSGESVGRF